MSAQPTRQPTCALCGEEMRHNVPRLGGAGGWVHAATGKFGCAEAERITTRIAKKCPTCGRRFDKPDCPFCAELARRKSL